MALTQRDIEKAAREQGWLVQNTKRGHRRFIPPDPGKPQVIGSGTPGDVRAINQLLAQLKRSGLMWPPDKKRGGSRG